MSGTWSGGKGDRPRPGTYSQKYRDEYDRIFKKESVSEGGVETDPGVREPVSDQRLGPDHVPPQQEPKDTEVGT
jgi:hypothetical protein